MDALSVIASVAGLISLALQVSGALTQYSMAVKGAPTEMRDLIRELESLSTILGEIKAAFEKKDKEGEVDESETLMKTLEACRKLLQETMAKLVELDINAATTEGQSGLGVKYKRLFKRATFPFKRDEVQRLLVVIRDYKATLTLAMTLEQK